MIRILTLAIAALMATHASASAQHWQPEAGTSFSIILSVTPATVNTPAEVVDLDLFDTKATLVYSLQVQGKRVVCYLSAGSWENWRPDRLSFPPVVLGKNYDGWKGERWIDIRAQSVKTIMKARLDLCKQKGFDGVDADNVDSFWAKTGFPLTRADAVAYVRFLATEAHARGLAFGLKNASDISGDVMDLMDYAVTEDCFDQNWCEDSSNFIDANKPAFAIEYTDNKINFPGFCQQAATLGLSPLYKKRNLNTWEKRCPAP